MEIKTLQDLKLQYQNPEFLARFVWAYSLCTLLENCIIDEQYKAPNNLGKGIILSESGEEIATILRQKYPDAPEADIKLALFVELFYIELFIDLDKSNLQTIESAISQDIAQRNIKYPWVYDRLLYDRFFENFPNPNHQRALSHEETLVLLENTPQGVFQVQDLIVGPFGILHSNFKRELIPTTSAPLWHCSDASCETIHTSELTTADSLVSQLISSALQFASEKYGAKRTQWHKFFDEIAFEFNFYDDQNLSSFPWLLGHAFSTNEIQQIFRYLLKNHSADIRQKLPQTKGIKNLFADSAEKVSSKFSKIECFQLILLVSDEKIISAIENLIEENIIRIPATEVRAPRYFRGSSWQSIAWECSQFGIRSTPVNTNVGAVRLKRLINEVYSGDDKREQLKWALRRSTSDDIDEKLDSYIFNQDPRQTIKELLLINPDNLQAAFRVLRFGKFTFPASDEDEEWLINKILWKLDFNVNSYPNYQDQFWKRHSKLLDVSRTYAAYNENDKESIRSASVNFFVSLEEILDYSLSFITWVLLTDHFGSTQFICNLDEARKFMAKTLTQASIELASTSDPIEYNEDGVNTLFPLIAGFNLLSSLCKKLVSNTSEEWNRTYNEFPRFYGKSSLQIFPFHSKKLLFDLKMNCVMKTIETLRSITVELENANVSNVRNRLQHSRRSDEFPQQDEIEKVCLVIASVVDKMEKSGISPLVYFKTNATTDQYDRVTMVFRDYKGREITLHRPSQLTTSIKVNTKRSVIIVPWLQLKGSSEPIYFTFVEPSDYSNMLRDFPKRRFVDQ